MVQYLAFHTTLSKWHVLGLNAHRYMVSFLKALMARRRPHGQAALQPTRTTRSLPFAEGRDILEPCFTGPPSQTRCLRRSWMWPSASAGTWCVLGRAAAPLSGQACTPSWPGFHATDLESRTREAGCSWLRKGLSGIFLPSSCSCAT